MNNKCKFLVALSLAAVFLFYRVDSIVAMAVEENTGSVAGAESEHIGKVDIEPIPGGIEEPTTDLQPEGIEEPAAGLQPEGTEEPAAGLQPEETEEPAAEPKPEEAEKPETEAKPEELEEPAAKPESEETEGSAAEPKSEEIMQSLAELQPEETEAFTAGAESEQMVAFSVGSESETIFTGEALIKWLESHKNTGGTVRLADHVVLDGSYSFCSNGVSGPDLFVDTGQYTITVTGEIAFLSNGQLTFSGEPDGKGVFYVAEKGVLSLWGISVESDHCALWQEDGSGLEVSNCTVSGDIHYADTPFVMYYNDSLCAVVEKGQTVSDALPAQIKCTVNKQGQLIANEPVALSWNLEGTEKQQEERRRFELQGSFSHAESAEPVRCTVVYNDYPLTFTDVSASESGSGYFFQGGFTAPEESLPFTVTSEYSFDGENWIAYEEQRATNTNSGFCIYIPTNLKQRSAAVSSKIYIRLQWNDNGTRYFSNVLCYAADNIEQVDDIGGSRGGGISIIDPPDVPQQSTDDSSSVNGEAVQAENHDAASDNEKPMVSAEDHSLRNSLEKNGQTAVNKGSANEEILNADIGQTVSAESSNTDEAVPAAGTESQDTKAAVPAAGTESQDTKAAVQAAETESSDTDEAVQTAGTESQDTKETVQTAKIGKPRYAESKLQNKADLKYNDSETPEKNGEIVRILLAAGFVLLSGIAGTAGFCIHYRSGTNR